MSCLMDAPGSLLFSEGQWWGHRSGVLGRWGLGKRGRGNCVHDVTYEIIIMIIIVIIINK